MVNQNKVFKIKRQAKKKKKKKEKKKKQEKKNVFQRDIERTVILCRHCIAYKKQYLPVMTGFV